MLVAADQFLTAPGPFLFPEKKGAHEESFLLEATEGIKSWEEVYGREALDQDGVKIVTAAPDVAGVMDCIAPAVKRGITFSVGHSCVFWRSKRSRMAH